MKGEKRRLRGVVKKMTFTGDVFEPMLILSGSRRRE